MVKEKISKIRLEVGIHTVSIRSAAIPLQFPQHLADTGCVKNSNVYQDIREVGSDEREYRTQINPNKYQGQIQSLSEYEEVMSQIQEALDLDSYDLVRVDFCLDNYQIDSYDEYLKLNKWFILMMAMKYGTKTVYQSFNPLTNKNLTIRMDSDCFQIEYYDKKIESNGQNPVQSRLELRSKRLSRTGKDVEAQINHWCRRFNVISEYYEEFQRFMNDILIQQWQSERPSGIVSGIAEFIRKYQECIFTDAQLIELCKRLGSTEKYARDLKNKFGIETYKESDMEDYLQMIRSRLISFTVNNSNPPPS